MGHMTARRPVERMSASGDAHQVDDVIVESPLALVLKDVVLATIMRTPDRISACSWPASGVQLSRSRSARQASWCWCAVESLRSAVGDTARIRRCGYT